MTRRTTSFSQVALIVAMLVADRQYTTPGRAWVALQSRETRYALKLSLVSCLLTDYWQGVMKPANC
jgi:hypothetical protein